jgi:hypothetical protein
MKIETQDNGYKASSLLSMISTFNKTAKEFFPDCTVKHFFYGDTLDMADIILTTGIYAHFNISENRVSLTGYTCSPEQYLSFCEITKI